MNTIGNLRRIGVLGGSFDPVHVGHLALGQAAISALKLDELLLIPAGNPWQKPGQQTDGSHRLAMLRLAVSALPANRQTANWIVDDQEIRRRGPSYTLDTLITLRKLYGPRTPLMLIIGSDQFRRLNSWYHWERLFDYAHIAVTQRERVPLSDLPAPIEAILEDRGTGDLPDTPAGNIIFFRMPAVPVSSTMLREHLRGRQAGRGTAAPGRGSLHPPARALCPFGPVLRRPGRLIPSPVSRLPSPVSRLPSPVSSGYIPPLRGQSVMLSRNPVHISSNACQRCP